MRITFFETAFTSIEIDGVTFVTDPVLGPSGALHRFGGGMTSTKQTSPMDSAVIGRYDAVLSNADADVVRMQYAQSAEDVRWLPVDAAVDVDQVVVRARTALQRQLVALDAAA